MIARMSSPPQCCYGMEERLFVFCAVGVVWTILLLLVRSWIGKSTVVSCKFDEKHWLRGLLCLNRHAGTIGASCANQPTI